MKTEDRKKLGKKNKQSGAIFEKRVRIDLEQKGWIVDKFTNTVKDGKLVPCQNRWNYFTKSLMMASGGFPDFICFKCDHSKVLYCDKNNNCLHLEIEHIGDKIAHCLQCDSIIKTDKIHDKCYKVIGVEAKSNGYLKPEEKQKCKWLLDNNIFSRILVASKHKIKNRIHIEYKEYGRF